MLLKMDCLTVGKKTLLELIEEVQDILNSGRYDIPEFIITELQAAKVVVSAADESFIGDMMLTLSLIMLPLEDKIDTKDVNFFKHLEDCQQGESLKELDSKTFNAIKYIFDQAADGGDDEREDIDVLFDYMKSIKEIIKKYKGR